MNSRRFGRIQNTGRLTKSSSSWSSRPARVSGMRYSMTARDVVPLKPRKRNVVPRLSPRAKMLIEKAHDADDESSDDEEEECDDKSELDESDESDESDYLDDIYDGRSQQYFASRPFYPINSRYMNKIQQMGSDDSVSFPPTSSYPILTPQKIPHVSRQSKSSPSAISSSYIVRPNETVSQKGAETRNGSKTRAKATRKKATFSIPRAIPVKRSRGTIRWDEYDE